MNVSLDADTVLRDSLLKIAEPGITTPADPPNSNSIKSRVAICIEDARERAYRDGKPIYLRFATADVAHLFDEGGFKHRVTIIGPDLFVRLPAFPAAQIIAWSTLQQYLLGTLSLMRGDLELDLIVTGSATRTAFSEALGCEIAKEPDGSIVGEWMACRGMYCPSVIVQVDVSSEGLLRDKDWWASYSERCTRGKLQLVILIHIDLSSQTLTIDLHPTPSFKQDSTRSLTLPFEGDIPDDARLEFLPEWFYYGRAPEWLEGRSVVLGCKLLRKWREIVLMHV